MKKIKLKPCPNPECNSNDLFLNYVSSIGEIHQVECNDCATCGPEADTEEEARRAWNALPRKNGWQPIETAPKDGTSILGWADGWKEPEKILYVPAEKGELHEREGYWCVANVMDDLGLAEPTHWMPLPEEPKEDK